MQLGPRTNKEDGRELKALGSVNGTQMDSVGLPFGGHVIWAEESRVVYKGLQWVQPLLPLPKSVLLGSAPT